MDFEKIKIVESYVNKIKKFKTLDKYKNMNNNQFELEMKLIFPIFYKDYKNIFNLVIKENDLKILDLMFKKLHVIEKEYSERYNEYIDIEPKIEQIKELISNNKNKEQIISTMDNYFVENYSRIIDCLLDDDYKNLDSKQLLFEQIKYNHETIIGDELAKKYIYPVI